MFSCGLQAGGAAGCQGVDQATEVRGQLVQFIMGNFWRHRERVMSGYGEAKSKPTLALPSYPKVKEGKAEGL